MLCLQNDEWTSEAATARAAEKPPQALSDAAATLLDILKNLDPEAFETNRPEPKMPLCKAMSRKVSAGLIAQGWFPEPHLLSNLPGAGKLTDSGHTAEHNALRSLKRKRIIGFNRSIVWLV